MSNIEALLEEWRATLETWRQCMVNRDQIATLMRCITELEATLKADKEGISR